MDDIYDDFDNDNNYDNSMCKVTNKSTHFGVHIIHISR